MCRPSLTLIFVNQPLVNSFLFSFQPLLTAVLICSTDRALVKAENSPLLNSN